jgi:hypothetical protein
MQPISEMLMQRFAQGFCVFSEFTQIVGKECSPADEQAG